MEEGFSSCQGVTEQFELNYSDIPHEAGHEETKDKRGFKPALKCDCLWIKTYRAVRQGEHTVLGTNAEKVCIHWITVTACTSCKSPVNALAKRVGIIIMSAL